LIWAAPIAGYHTNLSNIVSTYGEDQDAVSVASRHDGETFFSDGSRPVLAQIGTERLTIAHYKNWGCTPIVMIYPTIDPNICCWERSKVFNLEVNANRSRTLGRKWGNWGDSYNSDPRPLHGSGERELPVRDISLSGHNIGLPRIDSNLCKANGNQERGQTNFQQTGQAKFKKGFGGIPIAIWWLAIWSLCTIWSAKKAHDQQSPVWSVVSIVALLSAVWGPFLILLYINGVIFNSQNASASFGSACDSATTYGRAENVGITAIVIPELEFRNVQWQIFAADFVKTAHDAAFSAATRSHQSCWCAPRHRRSAR